MIPRDQYDDTPFKPTPNTAVETIRWAPAGVKRYLSNLTDARHLEHAPQPILDWMNGKRMLRVGRGSRYGKPVFTDLGKQVHQGIIRKLEGKS